ncbi:MAG: glycogen debranching protein GlgX [Gammaproteobacteria bacterium]
MTGRGSLPAPLPTGSSSKAPERDVGPAQTPYRIAPGRPLPLGVHDCCDGFNFAVFSRHAERVELLVFEDSASATPAFVVDLDPVHHRTGDIWHTLVDGVRWGQAFAYRVHGPWAPEEGHRFDGNVLLLDPYALAVSTLDAPGKDPHTAAVNPAATNGWRCLLLNQRFDWRGTTRPKTPWSETVIYETHVRGLTIDPSAGSKNPGTFLGVIEKIPYFLELGITSVELMPVQEFDAGGDPLRDPAAGRLLRNYWGYNTVAFFAPHRAYSTDQSPGCQLGEFKTMVRELHRAGLEVILDVVFNHTAEGGEHGPTFSFRGFDNALYYMLEEDKHRYRDFSGCGNTLNCNHPVLRDYVIDCLRYWVTEMQVDGFRFDLASILGRDQQGELLRNAPLLERIAEDPILRDVKLIAEAWDSGGAFQVGRFPGQRWAEWNCHFRDEVRRYWRGDAGTTGALAWRLCGSADLYQRSGKEPINSINFVTCHDGFTLNDLVSYARKHNETNGEDNRDGSDGNYSANYGREGPTADRTVEDVRIRQIKNMLGTLFLSRGVPMLLGGDEFRRTQNGNNNAYCQDNELSWYDWRLLESNCEIARFVREVIAFRKCNPILVADAFYAEGDIQWFGPFAQPPDWNGPTAALGSLIRPQPQGGARAHGAGLCLLFNASAASVRFQLPLSETGGWWVSIDTSGEAPNDVFPIRKGPPLPDGQTYGLGPRSLAVLSAG